MKERLELVRSFSELQAGMIVVVKRSHCCRVNHRGILTELRIQPSGRPSWVHLPVCDRASVIYDTSVNEGRVYRVVDDLESSDSYRRSLAADEDLAAVRAHQRQKQRAKERRT